MKAKVIEDADEVTYVVVCDPGDEAFDTLTQFARAQDLEASQITAVGLLPRHRRLVRPRDQGVSPHPG